MKKKLKLFGQNLTFKCFQGIALAQGWLITSYTNSIGYLTYDHYLVLYGVKGEMLKKIQTSSSTIKKV